MRIVKSFAFPVKDDKYSSLFLFNVYLLETHKELPCILLEMVKVIVMQMWKWPGSFFWKVLWDHLQEDKEMTDSEAAIMIFSVWISTLENSFRSECAGKFSAHAHDPMR